jgi:hypothetical protein
MWITVITPLLVSPVTPMKSLWINNCYPALNPMLSVALSENGYGSTIGDYRGNVNGKGDVISKFKTDNFW